MIWYLLLAKLDPKQVLLSWWLPHGNGYTTDIGRAGRYSEESAKALAKSSGGECFAIPLEVAERWARKHVPATDYKYVLEAAKSAAAKAGDR